MQWCDIKVCIRPTCNLTYRAVDWIPNRVEGYCSMECKKVVEKARAEAEEAARLAAIAAQSEGETGDSQ